MLGFDAVGRLALGQLPASAQLTLPAGTGVFVEVGGAALFAILFPVLGTTYAKTGNAVTFKVTEGAAAAAFTETGNAAAFTAKLATLGTSYAETGNAALFSVLFPVLGTSYVVATFASNEIVFEAGGAGSYVVTGNAAHFTRDFVNWFPIVRPVAGWSASAAPSPLWTPATLAPKTWTTDPAMSISPPVTV